MRYKKKRILLQSTERLRSFGLRGERFIESLPLIGRYNHRQHFRVVLQPQLSQRSLPIALLQNLPAANQIHAAAGGGGRSPENLISEHRERPRLELHLEGAGPGSGDLELRCGGGGRRHGVL